MDKIGGTSQLAPDGGDVDVNRAVGDENIGTNSLVHQLIACEDAAAGLDKAIRAQLLVP